MKPSQLCTKSAANLTTSPAPPYSISRTVKRPLIVLQPRPSPKTSMPEPTGELNAARVASS